MSWTAVLDRFRRARVQPDADPLAPARNRFALSAAIFLRLLAIVHFIAFTSLWTQLAGLVGPHGIAPAGEFLRRVHDHLDSAAYARLPTLCWIFGTDTALPVLCAAGTLLSLLLFIGVAPLACLALLWVAYLSLVNVGQPFLGFQWDALLLETTLLAVFLAPRTLLPLWRPASAPPLALFTLRWLLFRLMFMSGIVKLASGDPTWRNLTALSYHYETQPLPNPVAWWAHHLPGTFQRASCAGMFVLELVVPFFLFAPRPFRHNAALLLAVLQLLIAFTGNFAFFNLLTLVLCLLCLDDAWWRTVLRRPPAASAANTLAPRWRRVVARAGTAFVVAYTSLLALPDLARFVGAAPLFERVVNRIAPFNSFNTYGLFAVMTTTRPELVFEGSDDARTWHAYELPCKPGDLSRRPPVVAPYQPRLDWQLWFAALGPPSQSPWVLSVCEHLLRGTPEVLALFARNPFPQHPPRYVRVVRYDYRFTTAAERARTGAWWRRTPLDYFVAPASLR